MDHDIEIILEKTIEPELFRKSLQKLDGDFNFGISSMIALGDVYCKLYPESVSHGDSVQVQAGYKIVRAVIAEYLLQGMDKLLKDRYRDMFSSVSTISGHIAEIVKSRGIDEAVRIHNQLDIKVKELKSEIDSINNSVIKERFTGGITLFYNILYLMKRSLEI